MYGVLASPSAKADPSLAGSVGRIPENVPQARFLDGIPPHRFEPRLASPPNKTKSRTSSWTCDISMVECTGFEPVTSWLPAMRSTN